MSVFNNAILSGPLWVMVTVISHDRDYFNTQMTYATLPYLTTCSDRPGWFCSVGGETKVEQTIQRVSKGPGGHYLVGATRNASAVAEFELLFDEIRSTTNLLKFLTPNHLMNHP